MKRADALAKLDEAMGARIEHLLSNTADGFAGSSTDRQKAREQAEQTLDINIAAHAFLRELFTRKFEE